MGKQPGPQVQNVSVSLFPDYTASVQKRRATFYAVKKQLRDLDLRYSLLFPPGFVSSGRATPTTSTLQLTYGTGWRAWGCQQHTSNWRRLERLIDHVDVDAATDRTLRSLTSAPTSEQIRLERQEALQEVAALQSVRSPSPTGFVTSPPKSSASSGTSDWLADADFPSLPAVTPQTADGILSA